MEWQLHAGIPGRAPSGSEAEPSQHQEEPQTGPDWESPALSLEGKNLSQ